MAQLVKLQPETLAFQMVTSLCQTAPLPKPVPTNNLGKAAEDGPCVGIHAAHVGDTDEPTDS